MCVTSTGEVFVPRAFKLIVVRLDYRLNLFELSPRQPVVVRKLKIWLKPEFGLAIFTIHMHMHPRFLAGKKEKPVAFLAEYCRTHLAIILKTAIGTVARRTMTLKMRDKIAKSFLTVAHRYGEERFCDFVVQIW
jgi:hypothetical protein